MLINTQSKTQVWEHEFKAQYPEVSFPVILTDEALQPFNHAVLQSKPQPIPASQEKVVPGPIQEIDGQFFQTWELQPLSPAELQEQLNNLKQEIVQSTQQKLDDFANTRNYDSILSACTYATSSIPKFAAEGQYCVEARDATWATLYSILADVESGNRPIPSSFQDVELDLPALSWPE